MYGEEDGGRVGCVVSDVGEIQCAGGCRAC
jgi:hypothetical protein